MSILTYLLVLAGVTGYQMFHPQSLLSSICITIIVLGAYINQENPTVVQLSHYHDEMIMGFATLWKIRMAVPADISSGHPCM